MIAVGELIALFVILFFIFCLAAPFVLYSKIVDLRDSHQRLLKHLLKLEARIGDLPQPAEKLVATIARAPEPEAVVAAPQVAPAPTPETVVEKAEQPPPLPVAEGKTFQSGITRNADRAAKKAAPKLPDFKEINWEQFLGVKFFAWVGGLVAFLGVVFAVKYSFEQGWISPTMRVIGGAVIGCGLIVGGLRMDRGKFAVLVQALCSSGVLMLYGSTYASHAFYEVVPSVTMAFLLMAMVTASAFVLSVRMNAQVVAVLGLVGGFLTPILLSTGVDRTLALFGYIALLDIGLIAVALRQRWTYLAMLGAAGTVFMQMGWTVKFFAGDRFGDATMIFVFFSALFLGAWEFARRRAGDDKHIANAAMVVPGTTLVFILWAMAYGGETLMARPVKLFSVVFLVNLVPMVVGWFRPQYRVTQVVGGAGSFFLLYLWSSAYLTDALLGWSLFLTVVFGIGHSAYPALAERFRPASSPKWWLHLFPILALLLAVFPLIGLKQPSWSIWPAVMLIDVGAMCLAVLAGSMAGVCAVTGITFIAALLWVATVPVGLFDVSGLLGMLVVAGGYSLFFVGAAVMVLKCQPGGLLAALEKAGREKASIDEPLNYSLHTVVQLATTSAIMPFLLLIQILDRVALNNPTPVFAVGLGLIVVVLAVVRYVRISWFAPVALMCALTLELAWFVQYEYLQPTWFGFLWNLLFAAVFVAFPFVDREKLMRNQVVVATAALAIPLHFGFLYLGFDGLFRGIAVPGLLPALLAIPLVLFTRLLVQELHRDETERNTLLAWIGGAALFMGSLVIPVQFERQWLTMGWAIEGAALLWYFRRVPHDGLRLMGITLLGMAFVRLALNPMILGYERSGWVIVNWYLFAYGTAIACLVAGARLLSPPADLWQGKSTRPWMYGMAGILSFILLNLEIADFFSPAGLLRYDPSGSLGQDMTYSLGWAVFAFGVMGLGFRFGQAAVRRVGIGLLLITILKLFFHDLRELEGLYRVGSLIGLAIVLGLVSFCYQRMLAAERE